MFPLDLATFKGLKREFDKVSDTKIQGALDEAAARTDPKIFGALAQSAHMWLTAHLLAADPRGEAVRIKAMPGKTTYLAERERLEDLVGPGQIAAAEMGG